MIKHTKPTTTASATTLTETEVAQAVGGIDADSVYKQVQDFMQGLQDGYNDNNRDIGEHQVTEPGGSRISYGGSDGLPKPNA